MPGNGPMGRPDWVSGTTVTGANTLARWPAAVLRLTRQETWDYRPPAKAAISNTWREGTVNPLGKPGKPDFPSKLALFAASAFSGLSLIAAVSRLRPVHRTQQPVKPFFLEANLPVQVRYQHADGASRVRRGPLASALAARAG